MREALVLEMTVAQSLRVAKRANNQINALRIPCAQGHSHLHFEPLQRDCQMQAMTSSHIAELAF